MFTIISNTQHLNVFFFFKIKGLNHPLLPLQWIIKWLHITSVFVFKLIFMVVIWKKKVFLKNSYLWLVGFRYLFNKNYGWSLCIAKNMYNILQNSIKKIYNTYFTKTMFQTQSFSKPCSIKHGLIYYQIPYYICFSLNTKIIKKQKQLTCHSRITTNGTTYSNTNGVTYFISTSSLSPLHISLVKLLAFFVCSKTWLKF